MIRPSRRLGAVLGLLLLPTLLYAAGDEQTINPLPATNTSFFTNLQNFLKREDAERYAHMFRGFVVSGGTHSTGAGLVGTPDALIAYPGGYYTTASGSITYSNDTTCWAIVHKLTTGNLGSYTRVAGTHYLLNCGSVSLPTLPDDTLALMRVTTSGGAITAVADLRARSVLNGLARHVWSFGAVCDGVRDDAVELQAAITASMLGDTVLFEGTCVSGSALTMTVPITLEGGNLSKSILKFTGSNGLVMTHDGNALTQYKIRNLSITTTAFGLYTGIKFTGVTTGAFKNPYLTMDSVNVSGFTVSGGSLNEWLVAIDLADADEATLTNVYIKGKESAWDSGYLPATTGLLITQSTNVAFIKSKINRVKTGVKITGQSEGLTISQSSIVAVETGVLGTGLVVPSNAFRFSDSHISATLNGIQIDQTTTATSTIAHTFSNIFFLKRDDTPSPGGSDNYTGMKLSVRRSAFSNLVFQANSAAKDYLATGDAGISLQNDSENNTLSNIILVNPGVGLQFLNTAVDNMGENIVVQNTTAFTMTPFTTALAGRQRVHILYDTGTPGAGSDVRYTNAHDFFTTAGRALRIVNVGGSADTWHEILSGVTATATITVTIASPGVVTWTAHGFSAGDGVKFTTTGALPTGITAGTTYYIRLPNVTANTFEIATAPNGAAINTSGSQSGVHTGTRAVSVTSYRAASTTAADVDMELLPKGVGVVRTKTPISLITTQGSTWERGENSALLTLSTSGTTTDTATNLLPANSIIEAVVATVTTTITTATNWTLGDATTAGRFAAANATMTIGSNSIGTVHADQTGASGPRQTAAAKVRVTTTGTPGAGVVRITVFYRKFVAPTN